MTGYIVYRNPDDYTRHRAFSVMADNEAEAIGKVVDYLNICAKDEFEFSGNPYLNKEFRAVECDYTVQEIF